MSPKKLDKLIEDYLKDHKYIIYHNIFSVNTNIFNVETIDSYIFFDILENRSISEHKFNYYILIEKRYYKLLKTKISILNQYQSLELPVIAKFYKPYYNKEDFTYDSIKYVKIKLRIFSNSARSHFKIDIDNIPQNFLNKFQIKIMAVPVKKIYSDMFYLDDPDLDHFKSLSIEKMSNKIEISDNLNLYIHNSYISTILDDGHQTSKSKDKIIFDDLIDNFTELVKNHHNIYFDETKYLKRMYNCILENKKYYVELEVTLFVYFRHTSIKKNKKFYEF